MVRLITFLLGLGDGAVVVGAFILWPSGGAMTAPDARGKTRVAGQTLGRLYSAAIGRRRFFFDSASMRSADSGSTMVPWPSGSARS